MRIPAHRLLLPFALSVTLSFAAPADAGRHRYSPQTWRTENGLLQNSVHAIAQTSDGYVWLGTEGGLARFDGLQFVAFTSQNTPGLHSNSIRALLEDKGQSLWIATADGLTRLHNGRFSLFTTAQGLPGNNVWSLFQDREDRLWALTSEGPALFKDDRFAPFQPAALPGSISAMAEDRQGNLWLGGESGLRLVRRTDSAPALPPQLAKANVQALLVDHLGRLWIGARDGLLLLENGKLTAVTGLPDTKIITLYEDREGCIWVGTERGAVRVLNGAVQHVSELESLSSGLILSFFEDREGDIWTGTDDAGVTVLREEKFRTYTRADGVPDDLLRCVFQDQNRDLWVGTDGHGLLHFRGHSFSSLTTAQGLSSNVILSLADDAQGRLLVGTPDGLNILEETGVRTVTSADGLPDDFIRSIYRDNDGSLWMGTRRGLAHFAQDIFTTFTSAAGLPSDLVGSVLRGRDGCLWIGTLKGLACLKNGSITSHIPGLTLPAVPITTLYEDQQGVLWIGTAEEGFARFANGRTFRFPSSIGLPKTIFGVTEDSHRQFWMTSPNGLICARKDELNALASGGSHTLTVSSYGTADGLTVNEFSGGGHPTLWKDLDNTLWFATAKGLLSLSDAHASPSPIPPPVVLEEVTADDRVLDPASAKDLAPGLSRLAFEYAGLSFVSPHRVRFKYRLEGFDRQWIDAGTRRIAYYTNLSPRTYRFVVLARNGDGVWNTRGAVLSFRLRPHFYQTAWFYGLLVLIALALAYSIYRWRVSQVQAQFDAVLVERTRIAREIHDTLAQGFVAVSLRLELVSRMLSISVDSAADLLAQTRDMVQDSLAEARRSIWDLRSASAQDGGLPVRLSNTVRQSIKNTGLEIHLNTTGVYRPLPAKVEDELIRITQEAVMNVVRHAQATRLDLTLAYDSTKAQITIADNGRGFAAHSGFEWREGHFGLRGMRERADGINAMFFVDSSAEKGTQISVKVPIA